MIINNLDLGAHPTWSAPLSTRKGTVWAAETISANVDGGQSIIWSRSGAIRKRTETVWISVTPADPVAVLRLVRQLQELAANPNLQPVYIQWASGGGNILTDPEDGWYTLETVTPDEDIAVDGIVPVQIVVSYLAVGLSAKTLAVNFIGGPANVGFRGNALGSINPAPGVSNWLAYPVNTSNIPFLVNKLGGEGYIPISYQLPQAALFPQPFSPSATVSDLFKGRVSVYDTINTGTFPIPTGGAFVNSGWVEVLHPDHQFVGDCIITNGLLLLSFAISNQTFVIYAWNINTNAWTNIGSLLGLDDSGAGVVIKSCILGRVSYREVSVKIRTLSSNVQWSEYIIRLGCGANFFRIQFTPLSQTNTSTQSLTFFSSVTPAKICYTDANAYDHSSAALGEQFINIPLTLNGFGYVADIINNSAFPFIYGFLHLDRNLPNSQPFLGNTVGGSGIGIGDSNFAPVINQSRYYGFFVVPYSQPQFLQAEAETGTLGAGWSSVANAAASGGNEAKAASGTASGQRDIFGTSIVPPTGGYDVWFRVRVTSNAGNTPEMTLGLWDDDFGGPPPVGAFVVSATFAANQFPTTYGGGSNWVKINNLNPSLPTPIVPTPGHRMRFRAVTAATLGTDWFIDEAALVPVSMLPSFDSMLGPREVWSQFAFDRVLRIAPIG